MKEGQASAPALILATASEFEHLREHCNPRSIPLVHKPIRQAALAEALLEILDPLEQPQVHPVVAAQNAFHGHVLIVEDEAVNAHVAQAYVRELGCTSTWVTNGSDAFARCRSENFDLVLMDLSMPGMDGFATTRLIRKHEAVQRHLPIIALTAHDGARYREQCAAAGMDDLLCKPYTLAQCAELLRTWINQSVNFKPPGAPVPSPVAILEMNSQLSSVDPQSVAGLCKLKGPDSEGLYSRLVQIFHSSSSDAMAKLEVYLNRLDYVSAGAVCHKLAAAAANVGALSFAREVRRLERACAFNDGHAARQIVSHLRAALPALRDVLAKDPMQAIA